MSKVLLALAAGTPALVVAGLVGWSFAAGPSTSAGVTFEPTVYAAPAAPQQPSAAPAPRARAAGGHAGTVPSVSESWVASTAAKAGIPIPAMRAYARAQLEAPCAVGWTTLAGLGWVESQNGTIGGRTLEADGHSSTPILGPALDGKHGLAAVPATPASTAWHGDARWEHAVGPMQFIGSTWATWASDGDGDGVANPNDIDDAAYAAARYLCASGEDLGTGQGWADAVFSYNHSQQYVDDVYAAASAYDQRTR